MATPPNDQAPQNTLTAQDTTAGYDPKQPVDSEQNKAEIMVQNRDDIDRDAKKVMYGKETQKNSTPQI